MAYLKLEYGLRQGQVYCVSWHIYVLSLLIYLGCKIRQTDRSAMNMVRDKGKCTYAVT